MKILLLTFLFATFCGVALGQSSERRREDVADYVFADALVAVTIDDFSSLKEAIESNELFSQLTEQTKSVDTFSVFLRWLSSRTYVGLHRHPLDQSGFSKGEVWDSFTGRCTFSIYPEFDGLSFSFIVDSDGNEIVFEHVADHLLKSSFGLQNIEWNEESYNGRVMQTCVVGSGNRKVGIVSVNGKLLFGSQLDRLQQLAACIEKNAPVESCLSQHPDWIDLSRSESPRLVSMFARPSSLYKYFGRQQSSAFGEFYTIQQFLKHCCESMVIQLTHPERGKSKREFGISIRTKIHEQTKIWEAITGVSKQHLRLEDLIAVAPADAVNACFVFESVESVQTLTLLDVTPTGFGTTLRMKNVRQSSPSPIQDRFVWIQNSDGSTSAQIPVTDKDAADRWLKQMVSPPAQLESELFNREMKEKMAKLQEKLNIDSGSAGEPMVNQGGTFYRLQGIPHGFDGAVGRHESDIIYSSSVDKFQRGEVVVEDSILDVTGFQFILDECKSLANTDSRIVMIYYLDTPTWTKGMQTLEKRVGNIDADELLEKATNVLVQEAGPIGAMITKTKVGLALDVFMVRRR